MGVKRLNAEKHLVVGHDARPGGKCLPFYVDGAGEAARKERSLRKKGLRTRRGTIRALLGP